MIIFSVSLRALQINIWARFNQKFIFSVEELECLATWKEGSLRYLVGKLHHNHATSNEDRYRCFVYEKTNGIGKIVAIFSFYNCIIFALFINWALRIIIGVVFSVG